ncbi:hypothetical protein DEO72_LG6g2005 [Vigna unguiculata]|uniref:Uncharacterized protein n=1 Tax=Vigna unguiculata TaxID=3917 RepID=A0A4D6M7S1_VIGUN|nr:hypothetical protein DEO72_LG6g2005 [Vigna unguiculata]
MKLPQCIIEQAKLVNCSSLGRLIRTFLISIDGISHSALLGSSPSGLGEDGRDWWDTIGWNSLEARNLRK